MAAPKGNEFYKMVQSPTGRPPKYSSPEELWNKAIEYFDWVVSNPLIERKVFNYQGDIVDADIPKMRAMTENAFCLFAGISQDTFKRYKVGEDEYKDFCGVAIQISNIIYQQKFEGAAADFLNANIIARDLGLKDQAAIDHTSGGNAIQFYLPENGREATIDKLITNGVSSNGNGLNGKH